MISLGHFSYFKPINGQNIEVSPTKVF